jgi:hypothetical protein
MTDVTTQWVVADVPPSYHGRHSEMFPCFIVYYSAMIVSEVKNCASVFLCVDA